MSELRNLVLNGTDEAIDVWLSDVNCVDFRDEVKALIMSDQHNELIDNLIHILEKQKKE